MDKKPKKSVDSAIEFLIHRFYGLKSSHRPAASVSVNLKSHNCLQYFFIPKEVFFAINYVTGT